MDRDFMAFWRLDTLDAALRANQTLSYAASNQFSRVETGDTVWLVSIRAGRLRLVGRVVVSQVTDRSTVASILGEVELWSAGYYILPTTGTAEQVADIDIHHLVADLRFTGPNDRLTPDENGKVNGQQLQTMRRLAGNSSQLLADALQQ